MILGFKTQINGKPTHFVEKIWKGILMYQKFNINDFAKGSNNPIANSDISQIKSKLHTMREDKTDRWKAGMMIDFFINVRTKDMFRFAPRIPVVSTQKISIKYFNYSDEYNKKVDVYVDSCFLGQYYFNKVDPNGEEELIELAQNDGFNAVEDFFAYFNTDFTGKIIHWTDKKY